MFLICYSGEHLTFPDFSEIDEKYHASTMNFNYYNILYSFLFYSSDGSSDFLPVVIIHFLKWHCLHAECRKSWTMIWTIKCSKWGYLFIYQCVCVFFCPVFIVLKRLIFQKWNPHSQRLSHTHTRNAFHLHCNVHYSYFNFHVCFSA